MKARSAMFVGGLLVYAALAAQSPRAPGNVTQARVLADAGRGDNWLVNGGNFESQHFSPLKSITDQNIGRLGLAWAVDVPSPMGLSAEPIVVDGVASDSVALVCRSVHAIPVAA